MHRFPRLRRGSRHGAAGHRLVTPYCRFTQMDRIARLIDSKNEKRQRSFNWQSTAFVMRGLRVRLPSLAFVAAPSPAGTFGGDRPLCVLSGVVSFAWRFGR